ncbi:MAG: amidohydrolase family protein, partial [Candidatus Marinimicrobia bacterium]|nr:amidohydrolase family protein [Candidatus Neomarinimicrobiota bacterium]
MSTLLKNARIALPGAVRLESLDIEIGKGFIVNIGKNLHGDNEIDLSGCEIFPGAIDPHVHFDEPGYTEREDFYQGSCAAASGGVTTVIDMPCTSIPPVINLKNLKHKLEIVEQRSVIDFGFFGGVSAQCFGLDFAQNMADIADKVLGYKTYFISGMETFGHLSFDQFFEVLKTAQQLNRPVLLHAEDLQTVTQLEKVERDKGNGWMNYYCSRPESAEFIAVRNAIELAEKTGANLHIVHIGTARAAELLKQTSLVTGETCPHYLQFSCDDLEKIGGALKTAPVVKS